MRGQKKDGHDLPTNPRSTAALQMAAVVKGKGRKDGMLKAAVSESRANGPSRGFSDNFDTYCLFCHRLLLLSDNSRRLLRPDYSQMSMRCGGSEKQVVRLAINPSVTGTGKESQTLIELINLLKGQLFRSRCSQSERCRQTVQTLDSIIRITVFESQDSKHLSLLVRRQRYVSVSYSRRIIGGLGPIATQSS